MRDEETHPRDPSRLGPSVDGLLALEVDPSILAAYQGDRGVLLDYTNGEYFGLNEIAAFSWKMLSSGYQFEAIGTDGVDHPRHLMSRHARVLEVGPTSLLDQKVTVADAASSDFHADRAGPGLRQRAVRDDEAASGIADLYTLHRR